MANLNWFRFSFVITCGLMMIERFEEKAAPKYKLTKALQVANVDRFRSIRVTCNDLWTTDCVQV